MEQVKQFTGLSEQQIAKYGLALGVGCVMFGIGASYITCLLGVAYPAFMSFLALESGNESETTQWLTYWVVFGLFNIVDQFAGFILHFIPFYYFLKLGFLVFLFHPSFKGATYVYENYLKEAVKPVEKLAENAEEALKKRIY
jgi:receptor expression-enhancing protein 5/6